MSVARHAIKPSRALLARSQPRRGWHRHTNTIPTHSNQSRSFAAASIPSSPSSSSSFSSSSADIFTLSQIPQSAFGNVIAQNGDSFKSLSCAEYYAVAQQFAEAVRRGSNPWAVSFSG
ncbi:hypothetical protein E4U54_001412, partial [Claviceps lovelessii]